MSRSSRQFIPSIGTQRAFLWLNDMNPERMMRFSVCISAWTDSTGMEWLTVKCSALNECASGYKSQNNDLKLLNNVGGVSPPKEVWGGFSAQKCPDMPVIYRIDDVSDHVVLRCTARATN